MRAWSIKFLEVVVAGLICLAAAGCSEVQVPEHLRIPGGDPERGRQLVLAYECGVCHTIQDVPTARGIVGPKLERFAERTMLAGIVANVPRNLVPWLMDPPAIDPDTAMPDMGLSEAEARDIATFLYTLGGAAEARAYEPAAELASGGQEAGEALRRAQERLLTETGGDRIPIERAMQILSEDPSNIRDPEPAGD